VILPGAPFFLGSILCLAALWLATRQFSAKNASTCNLQRISGGVLER